MMLVRLGSHLIYYCKRSLLLIGHSNMHCSLHHYCDKLHKQHWYLDLLFTQTPEVYNTPEYSQYHALQVGDCVYIHLQ
jgi:hypothetical protein